MDQTANPTVVRAETVTAETSRSVAWGNFLKIAAYPISLVSGLWMLNRDIHQSTYESLKRYGAFKDILLKPDISADASAGARAMGLQQRNEQNIAGMVSAIQEHEKKLAAGLHSESPDVSKFLRESSLTRGEYSDRVGRRMAQMGMGEGIENFFTKWNYSNRTGKIDSLIKGATVTGIVAAVMLTLAESRPLLKMLEARSRERDQQRE